MNAAHGGVWTNDSGIARDVLLQRLPLGTDKENGIAALSAEGFSCQEFPAALQRPATSGHEVDCQLLAPTSLGYKRWIVELKFDEARQLTKAKVAIWNIFL